MDRAELARCLGAAPRAGWTDAVVVEEPAPARFQTAFAAAVASGAQVWVADPQWGERERRQGQQPQTAPVQGDPGRGWLCLPTGGTTGGVKWARHDEATLTAAVRGFAAFWGVHRVNACGVLPLHHVSGLLAWLRCALTGGEYRACSWTALAAGERESLPASGDWFLSLVPTQLQRLLAQPAAVDWLRRFRAVFLGGGPAWPDLLARAAEARLPLALSYGMTETAAMVTALRPEEFLAGRRGVGRALPHVELALEGDRIAVAGPSLFRGYYPAWREPGPWLTEDCGRWEEGGYLHVLGRRDALLISGGKKIDPLEVEAGLRATGAFSDVVVGGRPDPEWGQRVVAYYPAEDRPDWERVKRSLETWLAPFKHPKEYLPITPWPRNAQGKVNRVALASSKVVRQLLPARRTGRGAPRLPRDPSDSSETE